MLFVNSLGRRLFSQRLYGRQNGFAPPPPPPCCSGISRTVLHVWLAFQSIYKTSVRVLVRSIFSALIIDIIRRIRKQLHRFCSYTRLNVHPQCTPRCFSTPCSMILLSPNLTLGDGVWACRCGFRSSLRPRPSSTERSSKPSTLAPLRLRQRCARSLAPHPLGGRICNMRGSVL